MIGLIFFVVGVIAHLIAAGWNIHVPLTPTALIGLVGGFLLLALWVCGMIGAGFLWLGAFAAREGKRDYYDKYQKDKDDDED